MSAASRRQHPAAGAGLTSRSRDGAGKGAE